MTRRHGIIDTTYQNLVIDSGEVYKNYVSPSSLGTRLGATRGGSTFSIEQEIKEMVIDGAHGPVKGSRRIITVTPKLTVNFIEIWQEILKRALPGVDIANDPATHKQFTRSLIIENADYLTNVVIVGEISGSSNPIICGVKNALGTGNMEMTFVDKDEAACTIEFSGHFAADDLDTEPWILDFPHDVSTPTPAP